MAKYVLEFNKTGTICFTSHLDLMRMFQRAFKRAEIALAYSKGFNPHPKMGFAQPLSLGYWSLCEYIEFETGEDRKPGELLNLLAAEMPEGIGLVECFRADRLKKTLASHTVAAEYMIRIPGKTGMDPEDMEQSYMDRPEILAWKRQKKKKEKKQVDIRPKIREIAFMQEGDELFVNVLLDSGSASNLSPELIVDTVMDRFGLEGERSSVSIMRKRILFDQPLEKLL